MSADEFYQVTGELESLLEQLDGNKIFSAESSDFEYLGECSTSAELVELLESSKSDSDSDVIEIVNVSSSEEDEIVELLNISRSESEESEIVVDDSDTDREIDIEGFSEDRDDDNLLNNACEGPYFLRARNPRVNYSLEGGPSTSKNKKRDARPLFDVERVLATQGRGRNKKYFVKFLGYGDDENQWVRATDLVSQNRRRRVRPRMCNFCQK